jgi:hypothetical protein
MSFGFLDFKLLHFKVEYRAIFHRVQTFEFKLNGPRGKSNGPAQLLSPRAGERAGFESRAGSHLAVAHNTAKRYGATWDVGLEEDRTAPVHLLHRDSSRRGRTLNTPARVYWARTRLRLGSGRGANDGGGSTGTLGTNGSSWGGS